MPIQAGVQQLTTSSRIVDTDQLVLKMLQQQQQTLQAILQTRQQRDYQICAPIQGNMLQPVVPQTNMPQTVNMPSDFSHGATALPVTQSQRVLQGGLTQSSQAGTCINQNLNTTQNVVPGSNVDQHSAVYPGLRN